MRYFPYKSIFPPINAASLFVLFFILCVLMPQSFAARYSIQSLPAGHTFVAINDIGTIIGTDASGNPFVWRIDPDPAPDSGTHTASQITPLTTDNLNLPSGSNAEVFVTAINNEPSEGTGGEIIGWYIDATGGKQSVLWYQEKTTREIYEYKDLKLEPLEERARFCKGEPADNFLVPECLIVGTDDALVQGARSCAASNANWEEEGLFRILPCETTAIPICPYRMTKTKSDNQEARGQNDFVSNIKYDYAFNPDQVTAACILREHAQIAMLAAECSENLGWEDNSSEERTDPVIPTIVTCDRQSEALSINNDGTIVGVSYKVDSITNELIPHPVAWLRSDNTSTEGPEYKTQNLGLERINITPEFIKLENENRGEFDPEKSPTVQINRLLGTAKITSALTGDVAGELQATPGADVAFKAYYWPKVDKTGFDNPVEILSPVKDANGDYTSFDSIPNITAISSRVFSGWYTDENDEARAIRWLFAPARDENNEVIDVLIPNLVPMLELGEKGKILHGNNATETVGLSKVTNANDFSEDHAFYNSAQCGIQNLNQLLAIPSDGSLRLTQAYKIASGRYPNRIISTGINPSTDDPSVNYLLTPETVFVNLNVSIDADLDRLTVGDKHDYFITLSNNSESYATCVVFVFEASVYDTTLDDNGLPKEQLLAGLTFLEVQSQAAISCIITLIRVTCGLDRLDPGAPVSVKITTSPRALLADRRIKTTVNLYSTEEELTIADNEASIITAVDRRGCFIATAAYGSYLAPEVKGLRLFRDNILLKTQLGRWLVDTYYDISPPYADYISQHENLKMVSRWVLSPLVYLVLYPIQVLTGLILFGLMFFIIYRQLVTGRHNSDKLGH